MPELETFQDAFSAALRRESSAIDAWLTAPNDAFDGLKPLEVIERGEIERIWQMIDQLRSGVAF